MLNSYSAMRTYLSEGRSKTDRPLPGRSTRLELREDNSLAIRYHDTDVVTYRPDGSCALNSGGWRTVTTKARFNEYMPAGWTLYQEAGIWYLVNYANGGWEGPRYLYQDGLTIHPDGTVTGAATPEQAERKQDLAKQINAYCADFMDALFSGEVPAPSGGDCWFCAFRMGKGETQTGTLQRDGTLANEGTMGLAYEGKTWGEHSGNTDHLLSHLEDSYFVPSLLLRAAEVMGVSIAAKQVLAELWSTGSVQCDWFRGIAHDQLKSALRRYLRLQLAIGS